MIGGNDGQLYYRGGANVLDPNCPARHVLDFISDKWTGLIIRELARGTKRHSQLQRSIGGISQKMLTQTLRTLERNGLVERTVYPVVPPMVEYALTPLGFTLVEVLTPVLTWAEQHLPDVELARAARGVA